MKAGAIGAERVIFFEWTEEVCLDRMTNLRHDRFTGRGLGGVTVVGLYDATELLFASNAPGELGSESFVQYVVVHADTPMRPLSVIVSVAISRSSRFLKRFPG